MKPNLYNNKNEILNINRKETQKTTKLGNENKTYEKNIRRKPHV